MRRRRRLGDLAANSPIRAIKQVALLCNALLFDLSSPGKKKKKAGLDWAALRGALPSRQPNSESILHDLSWLIAEFLFARKKEGEQQAVDARVSMRDVQLLGRAPCNGESPFLFLLLSKGQCAQPRP